MEKTYLELLADNDAEARDGFEENARDIFVDSGAYDYDVEPEDKFPDEIEDQDKFQIFAGSRFEGGKPTKPTPKQVQSTDPNFNSKYIKKQLINIDSTFRSSFVQTLSVPGITTATNFTYSFNPPIKNVTSFQIISMNLPNTWYIINSALYNNASFILDCYKDNLSTPIKIQLKDGNYNLSTGDPASAIENLQQLITAGVKNAYFRDVTVTPTDIFLISTDPITLKLSIKSIPYMIGTVQYAAIPFKLNFLSTIANSPITNGLGYRLGFRADAYPDPAVSLMPFTSITTESFPNFNDFPYMFMYIGNYKLIDHRAFNTNISAFGKIAVSSAKGGIITDTGGAGLYTLPQPEDLINLQIKFTDAFGNLLDLNGNEVSMTLQINEIINKNVYASNLDSLV